MKGTVAAGAAGAVAALAILTSLAPGIGSLRGASSDAGGYVGTAVEVLPKAAAPTEGAEPPAPKPAKVHTIRLTEGNDEVTLEPDGKPDEVWCGGGVDTVVFAPEADPLDVLHDCEEFLNLYVSP